ncbi:hypothetical protein ACFSUK_33040 [Sphingobium scionense]
MDAKAGSVGGEASDVDGVGFPSTGPIGFPVPRAASDMEITRAALIGFDGCATAPLAATRPMAEPINVKARISCSHSE